MAKRKSNETKQPRLITNAEIAEAWGIKEAGDIDFRNLSSEERKKILEQVDDAILYIQLWISKYGKSGYQIKDYPTEADLYIITDLLFQNIEQAIKKIYDEATNKGEVLKNIKQLCQIAIENIRGQVLNKYVREDKEIMEYQILKYEGIKNRLEYENQIQQTESRSKKRNKLTAPIIACYCSLVNDSKVMLKNTNEKVEDFCKRVCTKYNITYTDRVRQNYTTQNTSKNINKVKSLIIPKIPDNDKDKINKYLDNKYPPPQKLYA